MPQERVPLNDLSRAWIANSDEVRSAVQRVLGSGWYVLGPETEAFEGELASALGAAHAIGVANGTDALRIAMLSVGCRPGSEVVMAANAGSYGAVAAASIGCQLAYADVDDERLVLTADSVAAAIGPATTAVVVTHLYGNVADTQAISERCRPLGISVIEDCAQSIGARTADAPVGTAGDVAAFSFYPTKNLGGAGDGGAVVTNRGDVAELARRLRQYGWREKYRIEVEHGWNSRLDEIQAAILRVGLRIVDELTERRRLLVSRYADAVAGTAVRLVTDPAPGAVAHLAVVRSKSRDALARHLDAGQISTAIHYPVPDHRQPALPRPGRPTHLPVTERACGEVLSLPCFPEMTEAEMDRVTAALTAAAEQAE